MKSNWPIKIKYAVAKERNLLPCFNRKPLILMYHGVTATIKQQGLENIGGKHVNSQLFRGQLQMVKKHYCVVSLNELLEGLLAGASLDGYLAITFDDGYANNYEVAAPILSELQLPATFFLSTGYIGKPRWIWTDLLEFALDYSQAAYLESPLDNTCYQLDGLEKKHRVLMAFKAKLKRMPLRDCEDCLAVILERLSVEAKEPYDDYRFMTWGQVEELHRIGFDIGAHTINHPILSNEDKGCVTEEIQGSAKAIKERLGYCSPVFCYPNGKKEDYNEVAMEVCRQHFSAALATNTGSATLSDRYEMRRLGVDNQNLVHSLRWRMYDYATRSQTA